MAESQSDLSTHLRSLEEQLLDPTIRKDPQAVTKLLADEFREFGSSGRTYTKSQIISELATESEYLFAVSNFICTPTDRNTTLVTYYSTRISKVGELRSTLRSSLWIFRDDRWQMLFHQGTITD